MTQLLEKAFQQASTLPATEQDSIAAWLMEELASEQRWDNAFASSADKLASLAQEALAEYRAGKTQPIEPEQPIYSDMV